MKTLLTKEEQDRFIELTDSDLNIETWEEFCPAIPDEEIPFDLFYKNYQEKHFLKHGKYLEI